MHVLGHLRKITIKLGMESGQIINEIMLLLFNIIRIVFLLFIHHKNVEHGFPHAIQHFHLQSI